MLDRSGAERIVADFRRRRGLSVDAPMTMHVPSAEYEWAIELFAGLNVGVRLPPEWRRPQRVWMLIPGPPPRSTWIRPHAPPKRRRRHG